MQAHFQPRAKRRHKNLEDFLQSASFYNLRLIWVLYALVIRILLRKYSDCQELK